MLSAFLAFSVFLLFRQVGVAYLSTPEGVGRDGLRPGSAAPDVSGRDMAGGHSTTITAAAGVWTLLVFGRAICPLCHRLVPHLNSASSQLHEMVRVAFLCQSDQPGARALVEATGVKVPVFAIEPETEAQYKVRVTPFAVVLDADGIVRGRGVVNDIHSISALLTASGVPHPPLTHEDGAPVVELTTTGR